MTRGAVCWSRKGGDEPLHPLSRGGVSCEFTTFLSALLRDHIVDLRFGLMDAGVGQDERRLSDKFTNDF